MEQLLSHASAIAELAKQLDIASVELLPAQAKEVYTLLDTANKAIQDTVDIAKKHELAYRLLWSVDHELTMDIDLTTNEFMTDSLSFDSSMISRMHASIDSEYVSDDQGGMTKYYYLKKLNIELDQDTLFAFNPELFDPNGFELDIHELEEHIATYIAENANNIHWEVFHLEPVIVQEVFTQLGEPIAYKDIPKLEWPV